MIRRDTGETIKFQRDLDAAGATVTTAVILGPRRGMAEGWGLIPQGYYQHPDGYYWQYRYTGSSRCAPQDRFDAEVGRRIALSRALRPLPRETRRSYWALYFSRSPRFLAELRRCTETK